FQAEDGIRDKLVTGVQTCALPICAGRGRASRCRRRAERCSCRTLYGRGRHGAASSIFFAGGIGMTIGAGTGGWARCSSARIACRSEERRVGEGWGGREWVRAFADK